MIVDKIRTKLIDVAARVRRAQARRKLAGTQFSVISNNCWGGHVYQYLGREYATPFAGLFLSPDAYLKLLDLFPQIMDSTLRFKPQSDEEWVNRMRNGYPNPWPIGVLGRDIEIQFMHYSSESEAFEKWERRVARMAPEPESWFFKFDDRDDCTIKKMIHYDRLPFRNKVFFTTRDDCPCAARYGFRCKFHAFPMGCFCRNFRPHTSIR